MTKRDAWSFTISCNATSSAGDAPNCEPIAGNTETREPDVQRCVWRNPWIHAPIDMVTGLCPRPTHLSLKTW